MTGFLLTKTPDVVKKIRASYPNVPIIATGGKTNETVQGVIEAGVNAITYTSLSTQELFKHVMIGYRRNKKIKQEKEKNACRQFFSFISLHFLYCLHQYIHPVQYIPIQ